MGWRTGSRRSFIRKRSTMPISKAGSLRYPSLRLSAANLLNEYPPPDVAAKRMGVTLDEYRKRMDALAHPPQGFHPAPSTDPQEVVDEMMEAKLLRAIYSQRQLDEQLADFWFNHFNVFVYKDLDRWYLMPYERDAIRPHVLGKFRGFWKRRRKVRRCFSIWTIM